MAAEKAWHKAFTSGSKSLQDRLRKVHAKNPEFQSFLGKHGFEGGSSVKQASKAHTVSKEVAAKRSALSDKAYGATTGAKMGGSEGSSDEYKDTTVPLTKDQHSKVQVAKKAAMSKDERMAAIKRAVSKNKSGERFEIPTENPDDAGYDDLRDTHYSLHNRHSVDEAKDLSKDLAKSVEAATGKKKTLVRNKQGVLVAVNIPAHKAPKSGFNKFGNFATMDKIKEEAEQSHKVSVTISDPNHAAVSMRKEKSDKKVVVKAPTKEEAVEKAKTFYQKKGYKVHDAEYHSVVPKSTLKEASQIDEVHIDPSFVATFGVAAAAYDHIVNPMIKKAKQKIADKMAAKMAKKNAPAEQQVAEGVKTTDEAGRKHTSWWVRPNPKDRKAFGREFPLSKEAEAHEHAMHIGGSVHKMDQYGSVMKEEVEQVDEVNARHSFIAAQQALTPKSSDVKTMSGATNRDKAKASKYVRRMSKLSGWTKDEVAANFADLKKEEAEPSEYLNSKITEARQIILNKLADKMGKK
jgi:hypothetical protein